MSDWRLGLWGAVVVLVAASFAWGGVQIADPRGGSPRPSPVDTDAPAARIAYDAMHQTETGNFVVWSYGGNRTDPFVTVRVLVDGADEQYRMVVNQTDYPDRSVVYYANEVRVWGRVHVDGAPTTEWAGGNGGEIEVPFYDESAVLRPGANVTVVERNASVVVVRVSDTDTAIRLATGVRNATADEALEDHRATLTLVVDAERGLLRRSVYRYSKPDGTGREKSVDVQRFGRWGVVDVERPTGIPYTFRELLLDMTDECPGRCERADP